MECDMSTHEEVELIVDKIANEGCSLNKIPVLIYKILRNVISPVSSIFNSSLCEGVFPAYLKISEITPLHKKGYVNVIKNYRNISQLSVSSI